MKKYSWFLVIASLAFACQLQNDESALSDRASGAHLPDTYAISSSSSDGYIWTIVINQAGNHGISHMNFKFYDCDGNIMTTNNVLAATVNEIDWVALEKIKATEGNGNECYGVFSNPLIKLDDFNFSGIVTVVITLDTKVSSGAFLIKASTECFGLGDPRYEFSYDCTPVVCYDYKNETAWADGTRYVTRGNWATYTPYQVGTVNLYAGQSMLAGTATMSAVSGGNVTITIALGAGWSFQDVGEPVKIQGYTNVPAASNPSPGRFANKGSSLEVTVPAANYYGIHLDVRKQIVVTCPNPN